MIDFLQSLNRLHTLYRRRELRESQDHGDSKHVPGPISEDVDAINSDIHCVALTI